MHITLDHSLREREYDVTVDGNYAGWAAGSRRTTVWLKQYIVQQSKGTIHMIRVLVRKDPFELHIIVNPSGATEEKGYDHVGDYEGKDQIEDAVSSVAVYLELEESSLPAAKP